MNDRPPIVAKNRKYGLLNVQQARKISSDWISSMNLEQTVQFGLPEIDDRYHVWRVPVLTRTSGQRIGEVVIDAKSSLVIPQKSTNPDVLTARLMEFQSSKIGRNAATKEEYPISPLRNTVAQGDSEIILQDFPANSVDLVFTSPPYYNARPEYTDYVTYEEYLLKLRKVIQNTNRILSEGKFFIINISPVLIRRNTRNHSSKRIAVPFDVHKIFIEEGFDFVDDIIWVKPEGAGWATGRGRRFAADRNPLQYKPVPVTEYVLVYRKLTDKLIDWHIRHHPDRQLVKKSRIPDGYERTNVWCIKPAHSPDHPAIFPLELATKVISYYSFINDVVLDPFAGIGTVGAAAAKLNRRFVLIEQNPQYVEIIKRNCVSWLGKAAKDILFLNTQPPDTSGELL
jgi:DNA modification methylase